VWAAVFIFIKILIATIINIFIYLAVYGCCYVASSIEENRVEWVRTNDGVIGEMYPVEENKE